MFFDKASQQAFVFPTKCGSQSARRFLNLCDWKNIGSNHFVAEKFIEKYPNLANYQIYAFFRDPVKRFESGVLYVKQVRIFHGSFEKLLEQNGIQKTRELVTYDELVDILPQLVENFGFIFDPQSNWYVAPNVTPLDINNMESELRRITGNVDAPFEVRNISTEFGRSVITDKVRNFVREYYAADYALAKDRLGKEYGV